MPQSTPSAAGPSKSHEDTSQFLPSGAGLSVQKARAEITLLEEAPQPPVPSVETARAAGTVTDSPVLSDRPHSGLPQQASSAGVGGEQAVVTTAMVPESQPTREAANDTLTRNRAVLVSDENGLRWREATLPAQRSSLVQAAGYSGELLAEPPGAAGPELVAPGPMVPTDPFADPFGDVQPRAARLQPPVSTPELSDVPSGSRETERLGPQSHSAELRLEPRSSRPSRPIAVYDDQPPRQPKATHTTSQANQEEQPMPPAGRRNFFNDRDCDQDTTNCQELRHRVRSRSIQQISLDISPAFNPVTLESGEAPPERSRQFEKEVRTWRDNQGNVVAVGVLQEMEHGRLLIRTPEGKLVRLAYRQLSDIDQCYFAAWWGIPSECTLGYEPYRQRQPVPSTFTWKAAAMHHKPLYFEEVALERYGQTAGPIVQPVLSGARFMGNLVALPYQMGIHPPHECRYPLGHYRPGNCAPWLVPPVPISVRGGLAEAGAVLGGVFVIP